MRGNMRILILDDIQHRHNVFDKIYDNHDVIHAYYYFDFCDSLQNGKYDLIHLDHDLGDFVDNPNTYIDGWGGIREYNGYHAARKIVEMEVHARVIVHSVNPAGAQNIIAYLKHYGYNVDWEPFSDPFADIPSSESE